MTSQPPADEHAGSPASGGTRPQPSEPGVPSALGANDPVESLARSGGRMSHTILVIEDEPEILVLAAETLVEAGHRVLVAASGDQAMLLFEGHPEIDLIFTDIVMQGIDGFKVADMAKVRRPGVRILYATGFEHVTRNFLGVVHGRILRKPYRLSDLREAVETTLASNVVPASSKQAVP